MSGLFDHRRFGLGLGLEIYLMTSLPRLALAFGLAVGGWWGGAGCRTSRFLCYNKIKKMRQKKIIYRFLILLFYFICGIAAWTAVDFLLASIVLF